jgi:hypothetical protein
MNRHCERSEAIQQKELFAADAARWIATLRSQ